MDALRALKGRKTTFQLKIKLSWRLVQLILGEKRTGTGIKVYFVLKQFFAF